METAKDRLVRYLQDAHATEAGIARMLEQFRERAGEGGAAPAAFDAQLAVTRTQEQRLAQRLSAFGATPSGAKDFFSRVSGALTNIEFLAHDAHDRATHDLAAAYAAAHLQVVAYESLREFAAALGDGETVAAAEQFVREEEETAARWRPLVAASARSAAGAPPAEGAHAPG